jgi:hypothetical protein
MTQLAERKPNGGEQFALTASEPRQLTPMDLLQVALSKDAAIDVIERLAKCRWICGGWMPRLTLTKP